MEDGISLLPMIDGDMKKRPLPVAFESRDQVSLSDNRYKIYSSNKGKSFELYDLIDDPSEKNNLAKKQPALLKKLIEEWNKLDAEMVDAAF